MSDREIKIFCPKCKWEPRQGDRWQCSCLHVWNTFDTNATCPACGKTHQTTQCLSCARKSPHCDWYHQFGEDPVEVAEEILVETEADQ